MARRPADPAPAPSRIAPTSPPDRAVSGGRRIAEPSDAGDAALPGGRFGVARLPGRFGILVALAGAMAAVLLAVVLAPFTLALPEGPARTAISLVVQDVAFLGALGAVVVLAGPLRREDVGLRVPPRPWLAIGLAVAAFGAYYLLSALVLSLLGASDVVDTNPQRLGITDGVAPALTVGSVATTATPVAEELVFRLVLFCGLARSLARVVPSAVAIGVAAVLTGTLFGLAHGGATTTVLLIPLSIFGVILCLVTWATRSLLPAILVHAVNNGISVGASADFSVAGTAGLTIGAVLVLAAAFAALVRIGRAVGPLGRSLGGPDLARL